MKRIRFSLVIACSLLALVGRSTIESKAVSTSPQFKLLYTFRLASDGGFPGGGVIADKAGNLYGTTEGGGYSYSTVYMLAPPGTLGGNWTETTLHSFTKAGDGLYPQAGLVFDRAGNLYGTTPNGGLGGRGVVFQLAPPAQHGGAWTYAVLHRFTGGRDGDRPYYGSLTFDLAGNLFGTTVGGGSSTQCSGFGCGTVFELTPPATQGGAWSEKVIHRFGNGSDGTMPFSGLIFDHRGNLYGTTREGGSMNVGTVFELQPPTSPSGGWQEKILYRFGSQSFDGNFPSSTLIFDDLGKLYGTTQSGGNGCGGGGCGTVFRLNPPVAGHTAWTEDILHSFTNTDGEEPDTRVIFDRTRNLFGTTYLGGFNGTVFQLTPNGNTWTEMTVHQFTNGSDGQGPVGNLIGIGRGIYGVTHAGGASGAGTVFEILF